MSDDAGQPPPPVATPPPSGNSASSASNNMDALEVMFRRVMQESESRASQRFEKLETTISGRLADVERSTEDLVKRADATEQRKQGSKGPGAVPKSKGAKAEGGR